MKVRACVLALLIAYAVPAVAQSPIIQSIIGNAPGPVSPGMPILINGSNLAGAISQCSGSKVPLSCGFVTVTVNNRAVPVRAATPGQVISYIPTDQPIGLASIVLKNHQGAQTAPFNVPVEQFAPGILRLSDSSGIVLGFFTDASQRVVGRLNPAGQGQELTVYAVGLGPTVPQVPAGEVGSATTTALPVVWIGTRAVQPLAAGLGCGVLCEPGHYLVRFVVPADTPLTDQQVSIEIGGKRSPPATLVLGAQPIGPSVGYLQNPVDAGVRTMSPGAIANVVGGGFTLSPGAAGPCSLDSSVWPTRCSGVSVTVNGREAAIQTVASNFIMIQIPFEVSPGPATLVVERTANNQTHRSSPFHFTLDAFSPTLMRALPGRYATLAVQNSGGPASASNPLIQGDTVSMPAMGLGQTNPPMVTGFGQIQSLRTLVTPTVTIGGKPLTGVVAEAQPGAIGVYRITATVPAGIGTGDMPILLEIGGKKSQDGLFVPVSSDPVISAVTNAASSMRDIVSGSWVTIYGRNLAATKREWAEKDIINDWLPTELDSVTVTINNIPAVVAFVSPIQLNVLAPDDLAPGPAEVIVKSSTGWQKTTANVKAYSPGIFPLAVPPGTYLIALHTDWSYVARPGQMPPGVAARPARPGETIVLYGTGFGRTDPQASVYHRFSGSAPLSGSPPVRVQIGPAAAEVAYIGLVGNGLYQINVTVPDVPAGDQEVIVSMGEEASPRGRYIPVER